MKRILPVTSLIVPSVLFAVERDLFLVHHRDDHPVYTVCGHSP